MQFEEALEFLLNGEPLGQFDKDNSLEILNIYLRSEPTNDGTGYKCQGTGNFDAIVQLDIGQVVKRVEQATLVEECSLSFDPQQLLDAIESAQPTEPPGGN